MLLPPLDDWVNEHRRHLRVSWLELMAADISEHAGEVAWAGPYPRQTAQI